MAVDGVVREWSADEGWGVIDSAETPGGCWAHFSDVIVTGYRAFAAGDAVQLEWESVRQDGYDFRAVRLWPAGREPEGRDAIPRSVAYSSTLTLTFDIPPEPDRPLRDRPAS